MQGRGGREGAGWATTQGRFLKLCYPSLCPAPEQLAIVAEMSQLGELRDAFLIQELKFRMLLEEAWVSCPSPPIYLQDAENQQCKMMQL